VRVAADAAIDYTQHALDAAAVLADLDAAIRLLTPTPIVSLRMSPETARTLAQAHMQRGTVYLAAARALPSGGLVLGEVERVEGRWNKEEFENEASRAFQAAALFGNEMGGKLAVATNPMARLCGSIVKEAMRAEGVQM